MSQFYPSLYTHAVGWAIDPQLRIRAYYKKKHPKNLGAILDQLLMDQQRKVSQGIPIGNDISFLLAEVVLAQVDRALGVDAARSYRWFDDYEFSCDTRQEAQAILGRLRTELKRFRLRTNPSRTRIVELPTPSGDGWRQSLLGQAQHGLESDRDMVRYFDNAFRLREEFSDAAVLSYAAAILFGVSQPTMEAGRVAISALTQALLVEAGCAQKVFALLSYWRLNGFGLDVPTLTRTIEKLVDQHTTGGVTSDVAWALQFAAESAMPLGTATAKTLSVCQDDCIALQSMHLHAIGHLPNGFSKVPLSKLAGSADVDGPHWMLCYEAARHGYLTTSVAAIKTHPLFSEMLSHKVTFLRTSLPPYASLLHPGGAPNWLASQWHAAVTGSPASTPAIAPAEGKALDALIQDAQPFKSVVVDLDDLRLRLLRIHEELGTIDTASVEEYADDRSSG